MESETKPYASTIKIDVGDTVICDVCCEDFTDSDEVGGVLYRTYAYCPQCAKKELRNVKPTSRDIKATAGEGESFKNFVLRMRKK